MMLSLVIFWEQLTNMHLLKRKYEETMMLLLWVKCLEKLYPPEVGLKAVSQKILLKIMSAFIKS